MAYVSTYLNFPGNTEEVFNFYKTVFGGEFEGGINRMGDIPPMEGMPPVPEKDKNLVMHVALPIFGGHVLMGTDSPEWREPVVFGNNMHISLHPDTRDETRRFYEALSAGGEVGMELQEMFWGDYYAAFTDKYGVHWMLNCTSKV